MAAVFFLGATGHIGGAVLNALLAQSPNANITALVRDKDRAKDIRLAFRGVETVIGSFISTELIESESRKARIVINTSPDHSDESHVAIKAILRGLGSRPNSAFYIQTSGAFLIGEDVHGGKPSETVWDDITDIERITTMAPDRCHAAADQLVRDATTHVNVALISPAVVYGRSASAKSQIPITIRDIIAIIRELSAGFTISQGQNILPYIHVDDLADIYVRLYSDAVKENTFDARLWGPHAYYFVTAEELSFNEYMEAIVKVLERKKVISTGVIKRIGPSSSSLDRETVNKTGATHGFGTSLRIRSSRAKSLLEWKAKHPSVRETLPEIVDLILSSRQS